MDYADKLELINGPEDGTEFALVRTPVDAGRGQECGVQIRFDPAIRQRQVRITAVPEGYRIRRLDRGRVWADGKRVGRIRSRILRHGQSLQLGNSELCLSLTPDGLAQRSRGLAMESDAGWLLRALFYRTGGVLGWVWHSSRPFLRIFFWPLLLIGLFILLVSWLFPGIFSWIFYQIIYWLGWLRYLLWRLMG